MKSYIQLLFILLVLIVNIHAKKQNKRVLETGCVDGQQKCIKTCECGYGIQSCSNNVWYKTPVAKGTVCAQMTPNEVLLVAINDVDQVGQYCPAGIIGECVSTTVTTTPKPTSTPQSTTPKPEICVDNTEKCINQCSCGYGFKLCSNNMWYNTNVANGTVCAQMTPNEITLVAINDIDQIGRYCPTGLHDCPTHTTSTPPRTTTQPEVCVENTEKCINDCGCGYGFKLCSNNMWFTTPIPKGTVCHQANATSVSLVAVNDPAQVAEMCPNGLKGDCSVTTDTTHKDTTKQTTTISADICVDGYEKCESECRINSGYYLCSNGKYILMGVPSGTVCLQSSPSEVTFVHSNPSEGDVFGCAGRITK